jgi:DNA-binding NarL/FixJ family response regulator
MMALRPDLLASTSETIVVPRRFLGTAEAQAVIDAIYVEEANLAEWGRGVVRATARAVHDCVDARLQIVNRDVVVLAVSTDEQSLARPSKRLALDMVLGGGVSARFSIGYREPAAATAAERSLLTRIALHLEVALRARMETGQRWIALDEVRAADRDLWEPLRTGRMSLFARRRGARGLYLVVDLGEPSERRRLSAEEESVLRLAAEGQPSKLISYDLELSPGSISRHLGNAAAKLGARSGFEVVMLAARLGFETRPVVETAQLTPAEREVLQLVQAGLSNAAIAGARNRSERTIANQVAALLRKTQSRSRRAVGVARLANRG